MSENVDFPALIKTLRELDHQQQRTDWIGDREVSWYYWRGEVELALGYARGSLFSDYDEDALAVPTEDYFREKSDE